MNDISKRLAKLSPGQRELLLRKLKNKKPVAETSSDRIEKCPQTDVFSLSFGQEGFWFLEQLDPGSAVNNIPAIIRLSGELDISALQESLTAIIQRHDILRAVFRTKNGNPEQKLLPPFSIDLPVIDLSEVRIEERETKAMNLAVRELTRPFDLSTGPLIRTWLIRLHPHCFYLLLSLHHIIADAWSVSILKQEIAHYYKSFVEKTEPALPELPIQYPDYIHFQRQLVQSENLKKQIAYWTDSLESTAPPLSLPADCSRSAVHSYKGMHKSFSFGKELSSRISELCSRERVTPFMFFMTLYSLFLNRLSGQDDIYIGTPLANREHADTSALIGLFINTVVIRSQLTGTMTFSDLLAEIKKKVLDAFANKDIPIEMLVDIIRPRREMSHTPLFQTLFDFHDEFGSAIELPDLTIESVEMESAHVKFDLVLSIVKKQNSYSGVFGYKTDLFHSSTIDRWTGHFHTLLHRVLDAANRPLNSYSLLSDAERKQLIGVSGEPPSAITQQSICCIQNLFESAANTYPDKTALVLGQETDDPQEPHILTYAELNNRANRLAHYLIEKGAGPETRVGILLNKSTHLYVALLGILKSGAAFVPLHPDNPESRLRLQIVEAGVLTIITEKTLLPKIEPMEINLLTIDTSWDKLDTYPDWNPAIHVLPQNLAYLTFTSGSSGKPKAVMISHEALARHATAMRKVFDFAPSDRLLQFISVSFDASYEEIFPALLSGIALVVPHSGREVSAADLREICGRFSVTHLHLPVAVWHHFIDYLNDSGLPLPDPVKIITVGGEAPSPEKYKTMQNLARKNIRFLNLYGPTESTITSSFFETSTGKNISLPLNLIPLGTPVEHYGIYLLDENMQPVPYGVTGEIYIAGKGLARGYDRNPDLTAEAFLPNPFNTTDSWLLYRSGDLARRLPDGQLIFEGRRDNQVKVRGFRIETGEIESALRTMNGVRDAVVLPYGDRSEARQLAAFIITDDAANLNSGNIRSRLETSLPDYMIPARILSVERFPVTLHGKIDFKSLREQLRQTATGKTHEKPETELQKFLHGLWSRMLKIDSIGIEDNFFELGGSSIQAATLVNQLQDILGEYVYIVALYDAPTIASLAVYLEKNYPEGISRVITGHHAKESPAKKSGIDPSDVNHLRSIIVSPAAVPGTVQEEPDNPSAVFILSAPRSGSTLLRAMLGGHSRLFAPPELQLLNYNTLRERKNALTGRDAFWLDGTIRAIMELKDLGVEDARNMMTELETQGLSVKAFYGLMQSLLGERIFVDKTPNYALSPQILERMEQYFSNALYIHLIRHPHGVIPSFEKARLHVFYPPFFSDDHAYTPKQLAELVWIISHENILSFLDGIPPDRSMRISYEQLVQHPAETMQTLCRLLKIDFDEGMLQPQTDTKRRMTDGINELSKMLGDVRFHEHSGIDARGADRWKNHISEDFLSEYTWDLARSLGYERDVPEKKEPAESPQNGLWKRLEPVPRDRPLPLSYAQQRLWYLDQLQPDSALYTMASAVEMRGRIEPDILKQSVDRIIRRHESLRTTFHAEEGHPFLRIHDTAKAGFTTVDLSASSHIEDELDRLIRQEAQRPFRLSTLPLLRVLLIKTGTDSTVFLLTLHHIIADGLSMIHFIRELTLIYMDILAGRKPQLPELPVQYADFAHWQRLWLEEKVLEEQLDYWREQLQDAPELLELPTDHPRGKTVSAKGRKFFFDLGHSELNRIRNLKKIYPVTPFQILLSVFYVLLYRCSGQTDILVGTPVANRPRAELEPLIGFFVNTLVLRLQLTGEESFSDLIQKTAEVVNQALSRQDVPFEKLLDALDVKRNLSHTPLFQVMFSYQAVSGETIRIPGIDMKPLPVDPGTSKFDLTLSFTETGGELKGMIEYRTDLFEEATIERLAGHYREILENATSEPDRSVADIPMMAQTEERHLLKALHGDRLEVPSDRVLQQVFEEQAERSPESIAVRMQDSRITFEEINCRANQLARFLRDKGVGPDSIVGLCMDRSVETITALLAILKAGGAWLPVDPSYPEDRIRYIFEDAQVSFLLTRNHIIDRLPSLACEAFDPVSDWSRISGYGTQNPVRLNTPGHLAYVIYTSGSTGRPKGVMITHHAALNLMFNLKTKIYHTPTPGRTAISLNAPLSFDASVQQLVMFMAGYTLVLIPESVKADISGLNNYLDEQKIEVFDCVPTQLKVMHEDGLLKKSKFPKVLLPGGEPIDADLWAALRSLPEKVSYNMYGPTECTVDSTICPVQNGSSTPVIGTPVDNARFYVVDMRLNLQPAGVPGELCIAGAGLARGYLNRPDLTAEKFIPDPFSEKTGERMYRSGDRVRMMADGNLKFLERIDEQVKVHGFRIEPGEIENRLRCHETVKDAIISVRRDSEGNDQLIAWLISRDHEAIPAGELKKYCSGFLPGYMIPSRFVWLREFPKLPNGKTDRSGLPDPERSRPTLASGYVPPETQNEKILAQIWSGLLHVDPVGIHDNFFELGGDSILSIQMIARARQAHLEIAPRDIFEYPTIAQLAATARESQPVLAEQGPVIGKTRLSPVQSWFFQKKFTKPDHWNQSLVISLKQKLEPALLEKTIKILMQHHDALRIVFHPDSRPGVQEFGDYPKDVPFILHDLTGFPMEEQQPEIIRIIGELQGSLNLRQGPVFRVALFRLSAAEEDRLFLTVHHSVIDGYSWRVLLEDLVSVYQQLSKGEEAMLPPKTSSYRQWIERLPDLFPEKRLREEADLWRSLIRSDNKPLRKDFQGINDEHSSAVLELKLSAKETRVLTRTIPAMLNVSLQNVLLSAFALSFRNWSGQNRLFIDVESHGREPLPAGTDVSRTIGWFTSIFPVSLELNTGKNVKETIISVDNQLNRIPDNGLGFGRLRYDASSPDIQELFRSYKDPEISFNYLGQYDRTNAPVHLFGAVENGNAERAPENMRSYVIDVGAIIRDEILTYRFAYSRNLFRDATMEGLLEQIVSTLRSMLHIESETTDFPGSGLDQDEMDNVISELTEE